MTASARVIAPPPLPPPQKQVILTMSTDAASCLLALVATTTGGSGLFITAIDEIHRALLGQCPYNYVPYQPYIGSHAHVAPSAAIPPIDWRAE